MTRYDPATDRQIAYIEALCERLRLNLKNETKMFYGCTSVRRLSVKEASGFIARLLRIEARRFRRQGVKAPSRPEPPAPKQKNLPKPKSPAKPKKPVPSAPSPSIAVQKAALAAQEAFANFYKEQKHREERFKEKVADDSE